jgi:hypothetical protein
MKPGALIMEIHHHAGVDAANAVKVKHRGLIAFNCAPGLDAQSSEHSKKMI